MINQCAQHAAQDAKYKPHKTPLAKLNTQNTRHNTRHKTTSCLWHRESKSQATNKIDSMSLDLKSACIGMQ